MLLINSCSVVVAEEEEDSKDEDEELGGLFKVSRPEKSKRVRADALDCSRFQPDSNHDWDHEEVKTKYIFIYMCVLLSVQFIAVS